MKKIITRETKHILRFTNTEKYNRLLSLYYDFLEAVQICINMLYEEELSLKQNLSSKSLPNFGKFVTGRWKQLVYKQASAIIRGTIKSDEEQKNKRYKKVYRYFAKKNRQLKFLAKHFSELKLKKYTKPEVKSISILLDERFNNITIGDYFDEFVNITLPYKYDSDKFLTKINIPIKLTKMDEKYKSWKRKNTVAIELINGKLYLKYIYEKPLPNKKLYGETIAIDFGEKKLFATSREEYLGTGIEAICHEINSCKQRSKHYYRLLRKRNQYIDKVVKELNTENVAKIVVEDLKALKKHTLRRGKSNKKHRKTFRFVLQERTFSRLENLCEEQGIELVKVSPAYTSQTCSRCGTVDKSQRDGEIYCCKTCGTVIDADYNASLNILHREVYSPSNTKKLEV